MKFEIIHLIIFCHLENLRISFSLCFFYLFLLLVTQTTFMLLALNIEVFNNFVTLLLKLLDDAFSLHSNEFNCLSYLGQLYVILLSLTLHIFIKLISCTINFWIRVITHIVYHLIYIILHFWIWIIVIILQFPLCSDSFIIFHLFLILRAPMFSSFIR